MTKNKINNPMKNIKVAKVTLNIGSGKNEDLLKKGLILFGKLIPQTPVKTETHKRIPAWGLRPGLTIGCKVTVRKDATKLLQRLLSSKGNKLSSRNFDRQGNFSFGIPEYIDVPGLPYDPDLKIFGFEAAVTLERPGYRVKSRKIHSRKIGKNHNITKENAIAFVEALGVEVSA